MPVREEQSSPVPAEYGRNSRREPVLRPPSVRRPRPEASQPARSATAGATGRLSTEWTFRSNRSRFCRHIGRALVGLQAGSIFEGGLRALVRPPSPPLSSRTLSLRSAAVGLLAAVVLAGCAGESTTKLKEQSLENTVTTTSPTVAEETIPAAAPSSIPSAPAPSPSPKKVTPAVAPSVPVEATTAPPAPVAAIEEPPTSAVTYANCTAARDAGAAPLHVGDPGYSTKLDRDKDGVACE